MDRLIDLNNHPKSIWYWVGSERLWYIPYLNQLTRLKKGIWIAACGSGEVQIQLKKTAHILFYGANDHTGSLPLRFLDECSAFGIGITIHRNNIAEPMVFYRWQKEDKTDLLTRQIICRENEKKRAYIARTIVHWNWRSRSEFLKPGSAEKRLAACRNVSEIMMLEAQYAKQYWSRYYEKIGAPGISRRKSHVINEALDSLSHFLAGITLRWVINHGLSPSHGFLHRSTSYPALVYDLVDLNRHWTEKAVFNAYLKTGDNSLIQNSMANFKELLDQPIHTEPTRQRVYRKVLIQGGVLSFRHYLEGRMNRFLPPVEESEKSRGRKRKTSYILPGQIWEK